MFEYGTGMGLGPKRARRRVRTSCRPADLDGSRNRILETGNETLMIVINNL